MLVNVLGGLSLQAQESYQWLNRQQIMQEKNSILEKKTNGFSLRDPYTPRFESNTYNHAEDLMSFDITRQGKNRYYNPEALIRWYFEGGESEVCGIKFSTGKQYILKTFSHEAAALNEGFQVTHYYACGACSGVEDLKIYLEKPDLTTPARLCSKKMGAKAIKNCYREKIGFSELCSEAWAYNSINTRQQCKKICIQEYGLINILRNRYPEDNHSDGALNPCIACDEYKSGIGFKYLAGRTRRGSGIESSIQRPDSQMHSIDHSYLAR